MYNIYSPESKGQFSSQSTANFSSGKIQTQPRIKCLNKQTNNMLLVLKRSKLFNLA